MMLYISMKFHENILKGFYVIEQTLNDYCQISKGNNYKTIDKSFKFLCCARPLIMFYVSMKFHENILKGFQITEQTRNDHCQISKGITTKLYWQELQFLCSACCLMMLYIFMKFHEISWRVFKL